MSSLKRILLLDAVLALLLIALFARRTEGVPQQLGGGVYDSEAAQEYWNKR